MTNKLTQIMTALVMGAIATVPVFILVGRNLNVGQPYLGYICVGTMLAITGVLVGYMFLIQDKKGEVVVAE